jgi:pimeloyl-ACP methyl ester carboxylesterase
MMVLDRTVNFVTVPSGVKLHYHMHGLSELPCIVLLNGLLSDSTMWAGMLSGLTSFCSVLTLDSRGQGSSDAPLDGPYTVQLLAQDVWGLLRVLNIQRPWLVGLSNGSSVGLELLSMYPGAFRGAVLASAVPFVDFSMELRLRHWLHCFELGGVQMQFDAAAPYLWSDCFLKQRFHFLKKYYLSSRQYLGDDLVDLRYQIEGALSWDIRPKLSSIEEPVLVLMGDRDLLTPAWMGLQLARLIKHSIFELVPEGSHTFPVERPSFFVEKIRSFIEH